jgi:hypothetical protein
VYVGGGVTRKEGLVTALVLILGTSQPAGWIWAVSFLVSYIHVPASIGVHHRSLSRQPDLRGQSCMVILNPEKRMADGLMCRRYAGEPACGMSKHAGAKRYIGGRRNCAGLSDWYS